MIIIIKYIIQCVLNVEKRLCLMFEIVVIIIIELIIYDQDVEEC